MDLTLHLPVSLRTTRNDCSGEGASNTPREAEYEHGLVEGLVGGQVGVPLTPVQSLPLALPPSWLFRRNLLYRGLSRQAQKWRGMQGCKQLQLWGGGGI